MIAQQMSLPQQSAIPNPLMSARIARPTHPALEFGSTIRSAEDLQLAAARLAGRFAASGMRPGDRVGLMGPARPEWVIALHAIGWVGATVVPLPPGATCEELRRRVTLAGVDTVYLTPGLRAAERANVRAVWPAARDVGELPHGSAVEERFWPQDEARVIVFTSGSTGEPSAVTLSTSQLLLSAFGSAIRLGHAPGDRWLACLPFHHVGGLSILFRCALYGTTVVLHERFRAPEVAAALDAGYATMISLVPTMLTQILDARSDVRFPATLRVVLLGGDAASETLLARCRELAIPVALTWGMTEAASQVATRMPGDLSGERHCGPPLPFARVESRAGVLAVRGPLTATELPTRDLGHVDRSGRVHVRGRRDGFVTSGGETVSLAEIETVLGAHPALAEAAVVGRSDARWGERPTAWIVPRRGEDPADAELRAWCRTRLSGFKVPASFERCERLPRTALGKLARGELRRRSSVRAASVGGALAAAGEFGVSGELEREASGRGHQDRRACSPVTPRGRPGRCDAGARARPIDPLQEVDPSDQTGASLTRQPILAALLSAAERGDAHGLRGRLTTVGGVISSDLARLEGDLRALAARFDLGAEQAAKGAARDLLGRAGKRLRPLCVLVASRLGRIQGLGRTACCEAARGVAIASELIHTATLLHDDVIDEASERRGAPAARIAYGNSASVLAGDFLFAEALRTVGETGESGLLTKLLGVIVEMVEAEALQLERRRRLDPSRDVYLRVCRGKTAALFRWALASGGAVGGATRRQCEGLGRAGEALGLAFQLMDDVLDIEGDPADTGKDALADLRQGKLTWPLILAIENDPSLLTDLEALMEAETAVDGEAMTAFIDRVRASGAVQQTRAFARTQAEIARAELRAFPPTWPRVLLETIVDRVVDRSR